MEVFHLIKGTLEFFDSSTKPIYRNIYSINEGEILINGFYITNKCKECGLCFKNCPEHCIIDISPYFIKQKHCKHCGICFENCPNNAIIKK